MIKEYFKRFWALFWRSSILTTILIIFNHTIVAELAPYIDSNLIEPNRFMGFLGAILVIPFLVLLNIIWAIIVAFFPGRMLLRAGIPISIGYQIALVMLASGGQGFEGISLQNGSMLIVIVYWIPLLLSLLWLKACLKFKRGYFLNITILTLTLWGMVTTVIIIFFVTAGLGLHDHVPDYNSQIPTFDINFMGYEIIMLVIIPISAALISLIPLNEWEKKGILILIILEALTLIWFLSVIGSDAFINNWILYSLPLLYPFIVYSSMLLSLLSINARIAYLDESIQMNRKQS